MKYFILILVCFVNSCTCFSQNRKNGVSEEASSSLKTESQIFTESDINLARENIENYPKAKQVRDIFIKQADEVLKWSDEDLITMMSESDVPRAFDLNPKGCPVHGTAIFDKPNPDGTVWDVDPSHPFQVICKVGKEKYPSNDYLTYYKSDFKVKKAWDTKYVDDGWGWKTPDGETYWFVAHANLLVWQYFIHPAISNLSKAYLLTGDKKYAHKLAVMLYRLAQVYPSMDYYTQSRYGLMSKMENREYKGKVFNAIQETFFVKDYAQAYDAVRASIDSDSALQELVNKDGKEIRGFIEKNLLEEAVDAYFAGKISGNYGMHQDALLNVLLAKPTSNTDKYINMLLNDPGNDPQHMGLRFALFNNIYRGGLPYESPNYNSHWVNNLTSIAEILQKADINLFEDPTFKLLYDAPIEMVAIGKYTVDVGDSGSPFGGITGRNVDSYQAAYENYKDPKYLNWLAAVGKNQTGERSFATFNSLFKEILPQTPALPNGRAVSKQTSRVLAGYGLGILNNKADETAISLSYGMHVSHFHWDFLNFELFANGQKMMPDLGYPEAMNTYVPGIYTWSTNTISHNTVVVDAKRQNVNSPGELHDFAESEFAHIIDASSSAYSQIDLYRRNMVLVDVDDKNSYVVDFFRVSGGKQHDYSLHGPPGNVETIDGKWSAKSSGTLAGSTVKLAQIYDNSKLGTKNYKGGFNSYKGSGFQHLFNVQELTNGEAVVQYQHLHDENAKLRIHFLPIGSQKVFIADAYDKPKAKSNVIKYLIARGNSVNDKNLKSVFVSVLEPFTNKPYVLATELQKIEKGQGYAVKVIRENAFDIVISDINNTLKSLSAYPIETDANNAVVTIDNKGNLIRVFFSSGTFLKYKDELYKSTPISGIVEKVDVINRSIKIKLTTDIPSKGDRIDTKIAHFSNPFHTTIHPISAVTRNGNILTVKTDDDLRVGLIHVEKVKQKTVLSSMYLPFSKLYSGVNVLDDDYQSIGTLKEVKSGILYFSEKPTSTIKPNDKLWLSNVGIGDKMEIKSVFSWEK